MLELLEHVPAEMPVMLTFWGSDLLRAAGVREYAAHFRVCQRADIITVRSVEMREILLAKFGRDLSPKVRIAKLGSNTLALIDSVDEMGSTAEWRRKFGWPYEKYVIAIGHNGVVENQHLEVLRALSTLDDVTRCHTTFVIPFAYGGNADYKAALRRAAVEANLDLQIMDSFLSQEDTAGMRLAVDGLIHVPISDALSATMCETLYAGKPVITGVWLPYGELRRRMVPLHEVRSISEVPEALTLILGDLEAEKRKLEGTRARILEILDWEQVVHGWLKAYDGLLSTRGAALGQNR
jgi:hypothetical protein